MVKDCLVKDVPCSIAPNNLCPSPIKFKKCKCNKMRKDFHFTNCFLHEADVLWVKYAEVLTAGMNSSVYNSNTPLQNLFVHRPVTIILSNPEINTFRDQCTFILSTPVTINVVCFKNLYTPTIENS